MENLSDWRTANRRKIFSPSIGFLNRNALTCVPNAQRVLEMRWPRVNFLQLATNLLQLAKTCYETAFY